LRKSCGDAQRGGRLSYDHTPLRDSGGDSGGG
jgi:hypothetical protein